MLVFFLYAVWAKISEDRSTVDLGYHRTTVVAGQRFSVSFAPELAKVSFSGDVYIFLSKDDPEPINAPNWIIMNPIFVSRGLTLAPGKQVVLDAENTRSFPVSLSDLERGEYYAQVVFDGNYGGRAVTSTVGNYYSPAKKVLFTHNLKETFSLIAMQRVEGKVFKNTNYTQRIDLPSPLLTKFYGRPTAISAVIRLPAEYTSEPAKKFPLKVSIGGFGGSIDNYSGNDRPATRGQDGIPFIELRLDGNCPTGHSAYANSANNGPWGDALVKELLPYVEKNYRSNGFRFVTGHSSGGWSSLWLQAHYPETFDGAWSSSPDAIDFRNFEGVNLYEDTNVFRDQKGKLLPGMTVGGYSYINYKKDVCAWEKILRGEQYMSFNAVFSGRRSDGSIDYLWDFSTGTINPGQRENWRKYDISNYLTTNWNYLRPKLANKILITVGDADNWALEKAVQLLKKDAEEKKMEIAFKIVSGDHFTVHSGDIYSLGAEHTKRVYAAWLEKNK